MQDFPLNAGGWIAGPVNSLYAGSAVLANFQSVLSNGAVMLVSNAVFSESILVTSGNISFIAASDSLKVEITPPLFSKRRECF